MAHAIETTVKAMDICLMLSPDSNYTPAPGCIPVFDSPLMCYTAMASRLLEEGHNVTILDLRKEKPTVRDVLERVGGGFDVFGVTTWLHSYPFVEELMPVLREAFRDSLFVAGGPLFTSIPELIMSQGYFDVGVVGEGESALIEIVDIFSRGGGDFSRVPSAVIKSDNNRPVVNPSPPEDLERFPVPALHLWPSVRNGSVDSIFYETSRGCPHNCSFCSDTIKRYHSKSAGKVTGELEYIKSEYGISRFFFVDPCFNITKERVRVLCEAFLRLGMSWECMMRVDQTDGRMFAEMRRAGCYKVWFGVESLSEAAHSEVGKGISLDDITRSVRQAKDAGLDVLCWFVVGLPGETERSLGEMVRLAEESGVIPRPNYLIPLPGTIYWAEIVKKFFNGDELGCLRWLAKAGNGRELINLTALPSSKLEEVYRHLLRLTYERTAVSL